MLRNRTYDEFMKDPYGYKKMEEIEKERNLHRIDPFVNNIKFVEFKSESSDSEDDGDKKKKNKKLLKKQSTGVSSFGSESEGPLTLPFK
mmetsp:Transcript_34487/g.52774  ORF Transcript_34487/g.52774 Transcript_34487/m.52774 type:complete len:89 (-) Transcript_34487:408-674(-)